MKRIIAVLLLLSAHSFMMAQELVSKKFNLPNQLSETSGLISFNGKLITHNDSGGKPNLYELNPLDGSVLRTIIITNAYNIDWEDIAQDENYIYISDSGNNRGNRTNLKVYKISKKQFSKNNSVVAEIIYYKYSNQKNFKSSSKTNFDAEALISYKDSLLIFSKNRGNNKTNIYRFSKTAGIHIAKKINTIDIDGQITGATYDFKENKVLLCGYTSSLSPFLVILKDFNLKNKSFERVDLSQFLGAANQVEGIAFIDSKNINFSRERFRKKIAGFSLDTPATVFELDLDELNSFIYENTNESEDSISEVTKITDELGKVVYGKKDTITNLVLEGLPKGIYYSKVKFDNQITINRKLIKE